VSRPRFLWPVYGFRDGIKEPVATFFEYGDAVSFVGAAARNLYIAEPRYDRRRERADLTPKELPNGRSQVAA
jgi:hypothetical protein